LNYTRVRWQETNGLGGPGQGDRYKDLSLHHRRLVCPSLLWKDGV